MPAMIESLFYVRETPWHSLGTRVEEAPSSEDAIRLAGLDWTVTSRELYLADGTRVPNYFANVRDSDNKSLGVVGNRYTIVQNSDAFAFTDNLLGEGVKYETAGSLQDGKVIWLLAKLPDKFEILGDKVDPYVVFTNTHDGSGAVRVAMTPIRVVCQNTLNMAMNSAKRTWSARHTGSIESKLQDAMQTLELASAYMEEQKQTFEELYKIKTPDAKILQFVDALVPVDEKMSPRQLDNVQKIRQDILFRYNEAPDLKVLDKTGARFIQAVADTTSHIIPFRQTANYAENKLKDTINGNALLDKAVKITLAA